MVYLKKDNFFLKLRSSDFVYNKKMFQKPPRSPQTCLKTFVRISFAISSQQWLTGLFFFKKQLYIQTKHFKIYDGFKQVLNTVHLLQTPLLYLFPFRNNSLLKVGSAEPVFKPFHSSLHFLFDLILSGALIFKRIELETWGWS